jgi:hypothetical protein
VCHSLAQSDPVFFRANIGAKLQVADHPAIPFESLTRDLKDQKKFTWKGDNYPNLEILNRNNFVHFKLLFDPHKQEPT